MEGLLSLIGLRLSARIRIGSKMPRNKLELFFPRNTHHFPKLLRQLPKAIKGWSLLLLINGFVLTISFQVLWLTKICWNLYLEVWIITKKVIYWRMISLDYSDPTIGSQSIARNLLISLLLNSSQQTKHLNICHSTQTSQSILKDSNKL